MKINKFLSVAALAFMVNQADAALVIVPGINVDFEFDDSLFGLFGTFGVEDDALELHEPANFVAETGNFGVVSASQATSNIEIIAHAGFKVVGVKLFEAGEYFRLGTHTAVGAGGHFIVGDDPIAFSAGDLAETTTFADFQPTPWSVELSSPTDAAEVNVKLTNTLVASILIPNLAEYASIRKSRVEISALTEATTVVPLPSAIWMLGSGLLGFTTVARRKLGV